MKLNKHTIVQGDVVMSTNMNYFLFAVFTALIALMTTGCGEFDAEDNPLKHAPHTAAVLAVEAWDHPYTRAEAVFPNEQVRANKFWPPVGRVDNAWGDRNLVCACPTVEELAIPDA